MEHNFPLAITLNKNLYFDFNNSESTIDFLIFITEPINHTLIVQNLIMLGGKDKIKLFLKENKSLVHSTYTKCNLALIPFQTIFIDNENKFVFESFLFDEDISIIKRKAKLNTLINNINRLLIYISNETGFERFEKIDKDDLILFFNSFKNKFSSNEKIKLVSHAEFTFSDYSKEFSVLLNNLFLHCIGYRFDNYQKKIINTYGFLVNKSVDYDLQVITENNPSIQEIKMNTSENPNLRIFKNIDSFLLFEKLKLEICKNERTKLADYSFVFRRLKKDDLIYNDISEKTFRDFLFNEYEIILDKLKTLEYSSTENKETLYNLLRM